MIPGIKFSANRIVSGSQQAINEYVLTKWVNKLIREQFIKPYWILWQSSLDNSCSVFFIFKSQFHISSCLDLEGRLKYIYIKHPPSSQNNLFSVLKFRVIFLVVNRSIEFLQDKEWKSPNQTRVVKVLPLSGLFYCFNRKNQTQQYFLDKQLISFKAVRFFLVT